VQRGDKFEEPVVVVLTSTGLKEIPATATTQSAADQSDLDRIIASLKER
jgi:hypothetical protein